MKTLFRILNIKNTLHVLCLLDWMSFVHPVSIWDSAVSVGLNNKITSD